MFLASALDGRHTAAAFSLEERSPLPTQQEGGWALQPVVTFRSGEKSLASAGIRNPCRPKSIKRPILFRVLEYNF